MAEVSDTKTSGTSLISSINQSGSGIDLSSLVEGLVTAETSAKQSKLDKKVDATTLQISSYGTLSTNLSSLSSSLTAVEATNARSTKSSGTAVSLTIKDETSAKDVNANITVSSLAKGQVITFDLTDAHMLNSNTLSSASTIDTGSLAFVMNGSTTTITISSSNNTLQGLIDEINKISGAEASLIDTTGSGGLALVVKSGTGTANTFSMTSANGLEEFNTTGVTSATAAVSAFAAAASSGASGVSASTSNNQITFAGAIGGNGNVTATVDGETYTVAATVAGSASDQATQLAANLNDNSSFKALYRATSSAGVVTINSYKTLSVTASDAVFTVDGLSVTRSSNSVTDVFTGYSLDLSALSSSDVKISSSVVTENAAEKMQTFLDSINSVKSYLTTETKRGINGAEDGSLVGDVGARQILKELRSITTQEIKGFGSSSYYLANLGVKTERDGTLSLDKTRFEKAIANDPGLVDIVFSSKFTSTSDKVSVTGSETLPPTPGSYDFNFTQSTGIGVLNAQSLEALTNSSGNKSYTGSAGDAKNMYVEVLNDSSDITGTVRYGRSLIDTLQAYIKDVTSSTGLIKSRTATLNDQIATFENDQTDLDEKIEALRSNYNEQFGNMESLVTQLNKTGEYLTSMMDAWNKKD
jgi:flagellar hook-associated protein 2